MPIASGTHANRSGLSDSITGAMTTGATTAAGGAGGGDGGGGGGSAGFGGSGATATGGGGGWGFADADAGAGASDLNTQPDSGADVTSAGASNDGFARFRGRAGCLAKTVILHGACEAGSRDPARAGAPR